MSIVDLSAEPLTRENFSGFGDVLEVKGAERILINEATTERFHALARLDVADQKGEGVLSIFRATARPSPIKVAMMERHPLGSQAFFPLANKRWLVVVSAAQTPAPDNLKAFWARGDQGVQYAKNIWHHPLLIIEPSQDFLVADRAGPGDNLEEVWFGNGAYARLALPRD
jgi:ureidoglycolate lyase